RTFAENSRHITLAVEQMHARPQQGLTVVGETTRLRGMLPIIVAQLSKTYAQLTIRVEAMDDDIQVGEALRAGRADLGVFTLRQDADVHDDELELTRVYDIGPTGACLPDGHAALRLPPGPLPLSALRTDRLIVLEEPRSMEMAAIAFPEADRGNGVSLVDDIALGVRLARSGAGVMIVNGLSAYLADRDVSWRAIAGAPSYSLCLAQLRGRVLSPVATDFARYATLVADSGSKVFRYLPATGCYETGPGIDHWVATRGVDFSLAAAPRGSGTRTYSAADSKP
ncbi:MAG: hypothetical protein JWN39_3519, partial [Ilumatobacteraceae bacterium]|nr:hypothetical protein [Ilumatobacteraceae bacterium]